MPSVHHVIVAYEDDLDFKLDPSSNGEGGLARSMGESLEWLAYEATEEEVPRVLAAAVVLYQRGAGKIGQCLDTAIVWERG